MPQKRITELDGIRGIAIASVLIFHYIGDPRYSRWIGGYAGWLGVNLFFVLSGFLITRILLTSRNTPNYYERFYGRRAQRILPPFYATLGILFFASLLVDKNQPFDFWAMHACFLTCYITPELTFGHSTTVPLYAILGVGVLWSLSVEEQFYLLWAPIVRHFRVTTLLWILIAVLGIEPLIRYVVSDPWRVSHLFPTRLDDLAVGSILAILINSPEDIPDRLRRIFLLAVNNGQWLALIPLALVVAWGPYVTHSHIFAVFGYTIIAIGFGSFVGYSVVNSGKEGRLLSMLRINPLRQLGTISYTLYLVHMAVRGVVDVAFMHTFGLHSSTQRIMDRLISLALSIAIAAISWEFMEKPILNHSFFLRHPGNDTVKAS